MNQPTVRNRSVKVGWSCGAQPFCGHRWRLTARLHSFVHRDSFLADMWRAYGLWIINAMLVAVGVIGGYLLLPYLIHLSAGAKLFCLAVMAIIAYRYLRKSRSR